MSFWRCLTYLTGQSCLRTYSREGKARASGRPSTPRMHAPSVRGTRARNGAGDRVVWRVRSSGGSPRLVGATSPAHACWTRDSTVRASKSDAIFIICATLICNKLAVTCTCSWSDKYWLIPDAYNGPTLSRASRSCRIQLDIMRPWRSLVVSGTSAPWLPACRWLQWSYKCCNHACMSTFWS